MFKIPLILILLLSPILTEGQITSSILLSRAVSSVTSYEMVIKDGKESGDSIFKSQEYYNKFGFKTKAINKYETSTSISEYLIKSDSICVQVTHTISPINYVRSIEYMKYDKNGNLIKVFEKKGKVKKLIKQIWYNKTGQKAKITY